MWIYVCALFSLCFTVLVCDHMGFNTWKPVFGVCKQSRRRLSQLLCYLPFGQYHILTCYKRNFNFLASLCSWGDWFESHFVRTPKTDFVASMPMWIRSLKINIFPCKCVYICIPVCALFSLCYTMLVVIADLLNCDCCLAMLAVYYIWKDCSV